MSISITKLPHSEVELAGEISAEELERAWGRVVKEAVAEAEFPGFRKGQAPEDMIIRNKGENWLLHRAAEFALGTAWPKAIEETGVQAIGLPDIQIHKLVRGNPLEWKARVAVLPAIELPDYRALANQMKIDAPDKSIGNGKEGETKDDFQKAKEKQRLALLEAIAAQSAMDLPAILKETEKTKMAQELRAGLESMGLKWEDYLTHVKKNEKEILDGFDNEAEKRARFGLVLKEIAKQEHIDPTPQEVGERVRQMLPAYTPEEQKRLDKNRLESYAYGIIRNEKVFELLEKI
jgi:FKBP-type peptidyl-prolyl cis-trans isomerase (trigger factor)